MSIFFNFEVGPRGRRFRRAVDQDKKDIEYIWKKEETETLFCVDDFGSLIELSTLAIVMIDTQKNVSGFMALSDHPPLPAVDPASWEVWIRNMFRKFYLASNTLFIHFMCCVESVSEFFLEEALVSVFMNDCYLRQIVLVVPPTCKIEDCMAKYPTFRRRSIYKHCTIVGEEQSCVALFVALRADFCPSLKVRRAVEEDNDDVVQILDKRCKLLKDMYGEYYISEILSRHPESNRMIIVAEDDSVHLDGQKVVGAMCLNSTVNYEKLQHVYELAPYHGLVKMDPVKREELKRSNNLLEIFGKPIMTGKWSPFDSPDKKDSARNDLNLDKRTSVKERTSQRGSKSSKVNFRGSRLRQAKVRRSDTAHTSYESDKIYSPTLSINADISTMLLIDDEPLDYEIVNIDTNLFNIPEVPSRDTLVSTSARVSQNMSGHKLRRRKSSMTKFSDVGLVFDGKPNAFIIELFGLIDEVDDRRAFDMLEAAFECMPNLDYCIIRIPSAKKTFSLLQHFTVVPTKPNICCKYALYVAHRNSVLGKLRIRKAEVADIPQIALLLQNVEGKETIWTVENAIQIPHQQLAYVFLCGYSLIGVGILDPPEHTELIRAKFVVESHQRIKYHISGQGLDGGISMIKTVLVYPAFEPHFAFFARDMMRLSGSNTLMWLTAYRNKWVAHKANGIVSAMTPLSFRTTSTYGLLPELKHVYNISKNLLSFSAWFVSKKLTSIQKLNVDTRIVVVGASKTAIAFLFTLIFGDSATYLNFTNVTLVSTNGLPYLRHPIPATDFMFPKHHCLSDRFLKSTPFTYYVNVVQATMVEINKQDKCIVTEYGSKYYYDLLFLMIGKQYQHPHYMKALTERDREIGLNKIPQYVRMDDPQFIKSQLEPRLDYDTPENVFLVNNLHDANSALSYVKTFFWRFDDYKVVVYGAGIDAYCCLTALLDLEVPPEHIIFVESFPPADEEKPRVSFFCNNKVDHSVKSYIETLGLVTYRGYYFEDWNVDEYNVLQSVEFISHYNYLKLDCAAFFYYGKRNINPHAFVSINKCGLAYDGGILIDHNWRTNDPAIYAAGTVTRYYRRYMADSKLQKFYDTYEIGKTLGIQIRNELDPQFSEIKEDNWIQTDEGSGSSGTSNSFKTGSCPHSKSSSSSSASNSSSSSSKRVHKVKDHSVCYPCLIPRLKQPLVWYCILPGNLQYLEVRPPGAKFPHYYIQAKHHNGTLLETFKSGYFKLHINNELIVDGITCLTPDSRSIENFKMLYGHSAAVLNNVHVRFMSRSIDDLYDFFRLPWSMFLYNELSDELFSIAKHLKPKGAPQGKTLQEILYEISSNLNDENINNETLERVHFDFEKNFEAITEYVIDWLKDDDLIQSLYATPNNLLEFSHDLRQNPAFKRCRRTIKRMLAMIA